MTHAPETASRPAAGRRAVMALLGVASAGIVGGGALLLPEMIRRDPLRRDPVDVPEVAGLTREKASAELEARRLTPLIVEQDHDTVAAGSVISSDPVAGRTLRQQDTVRLVVSSGPGHRTVPKALVGKSEAEAREAVRAAGLETKASLTQHSAAAPAGEVLGVSPPPGSQVPKGTAIVLTVASGKVVVPLLVGLSASDARARLEKPSVGLSSEVSYSTTTAKPAGSVISQSAAPNSAVPRGTKVALVVAAAPPAPKKPAPSPSGRPTSSSSPEPRSTPKPKKS